MDVARRRKRGCITCSNEQNFVTNSIQVVETTTAIINVENTASNYYRTKLILLHLAHNFLYFSKERHLWRGERVNNLTIPEK